jgi:putative IMPACT (imprinted ancient) family translation regulator
MVHKTLACQYTQVNDVLHVLEQTGGEVLQQDYTDSVFFTLALPEERLNQIQEQLTTLSSGQLILKTLPDEN